MNSFADALKRANIEVQEPEFEPYETIEGVKLPVFLDKFFAPEVSLQELSDANYIRRTAKSMEPMDFSKRVALFENNHPVKKWVLKHIDKCREINKGTYHKDESSFSNSKDFDEKYKKDTNYGLCCLGFYIKYSKAHRKLYIETNSLWDSVLKTCGYTLQGITGKSWASELSSEDEVKILDILVEISEFIPVEIEDIASPYWNDHSSKHFFKEPDIHTLGINILESKAAMDALEDWVCAGGKINPRVWYFLKESADGSWYLKRDLESSPRLEK